MTLLDASLKLSRRNFALDVAIQMQSPQVLVVAGRSGSGKTTLLRCLAGLEPAVQGHVFVGDDVWLDRDRGRNLAVHRRRVGYVTQDAHLFPHLSVRQNLLFGAHRQRLTVERDRFDQLAQALSLATLLDRSVATLSGGERQRVAIGRVLLSQPQLLLMDEPVAHLDTESAALVLDGLDETLRSNGTSCVYVTHNLREAARVADQVMWLEAGQVKAAGPVADALSDPALPFAWVQEAGSVIEGTVLIRDDESALAQVDFGAGRLWVPTATAAVGSRVRVQIAARDVGIALQVPHEISILNALEGWVVDIVAGADASHALVQVDVGGVRLLARVTRRSVRLLPLAAGTRVWALVKSASLAR
jgi:molybdate transport system ATP-binding protein